MTDHETKAGVALSAKATATPPTRRGRPSPEQSAAITATILRVAEEMFKTEGFDATSMEAVAVKAGVPKVTLYKRFADKRRLLEAVLQEKVVHWGQAHAQRKRALGNDLRQRIVHYTVSMMTWGSNPEVRLFMGLAAGAYGFSGPRANRHGFFAYDRMMDLIVADIVKFGPPQGIVASDPVRLVNALMSFVSGWLDRQGSDLSSSPAQIQADAEYIAALLFDGTRAW